MHPVHPGDDGQRNGRDDRIRLLVTDNQIIDPPVGGGRLRIWELYRHLPADFVTIYVGTHDHPGPVYRDRWLAPNFREIIMPLTMVHFKAHGLWRRLTRGDATVDVTIPLLLGLCSPRYRRLIDTCLPGVDALVYAHPWMFPFLPARLAIPRIYDSQNCEGVLKRTLLDRTIAGRYLARRVVETEGAAARAADRVLVVTEQDAAQFRELYGIAASRLVSVPNGVDCSRIRPPAREDKPGLKRRLDLPEATLAVFIGSQYGPNNDAADYLIRTLAPAVPDITIGIVGGVGTAWRERHPGQPLPANVRLFGTVEIAKLDLILQAADIGINPMTRGSGTNIKMLDFMAAGLAILTTAVGARGISGTAWVLAEIEMFPAELRALAADAGRRGRLGEEARRRAEEHHDWKGVSARLAQTLRDLVGRPDARAG